MAQIDLGSAELNQALGTLLESSMSGMMAGKLKQILEDGQAAIKKVAELNQIVEAKAAENKKLSDKIFELNGELQKHSALNARETEAAARKLALDERERDIRVKEIEALLEAEKRVSSTVITTLTGLARNVEYRQSFMETINNKSHAVPGGAGAMGTIMQSYNPEQTTRTETKTAE